jgi:hypothetical protein
VNGICSGLHPVAGFVIDGNESYSTAIELVINHMISAYFQTVNILFLAHSVGTFFKVLCYKFNLFQNHWFKKSVSERNMII